MPFTLEDLDRITVRVGMSTKSLRDMSDTQFTAWLRAQGARGEIGVVTVRPGEIAIPIEERVRVLNDLDREGFYIPGVMGEARTSVGPDLGQLQRARDNLLAAAQHLSEVEAALGELGEIDPRVNLRASIGGAVQLVELMQGAVDHVLRERGAA